MELEKVLSHVADLLEREDIEYRAGIDPDTKTSYLQCNWFINDFWQTASVVIDCMPYLNELWPADPELYWLIPVEILLPIHLEDEEREQAVVNVINSINQRYRVGHYEVDDRRIVLKHSIFLNHSYYNSNIILELVEILIKQVRKDMDTFFNINLGFIE